MGLQIVLLCLFYLYVGRLSNSVGLDSKIFLQPGTVMLASILSLDSFYLDTFYLDTFAAAGFYLYTFVVAGFYLVTFAVAAFYLVTFAAAGFLS